MADGVKKEKLQNWVEHDLVDRFEGRVLGLDMDTALVWGRFQGEAELKGEKLPVMDSLIAATAASHGLFVVTRNTRDLERCHAKVFDPWGGEGDLTKRLGLTHKDEVGKAAGLINQFIAKVQHSVAQSADSSNETAVASQELSHIVSSQSDNI